MIFAMMLVLFVVLDKVESDGFAGMATFAFLEVMFEIALLGNYLSKHGVI